MPYRVTIEEVSGAPGDPGHKKIYEQTVEVIDIRAVMSAVNVRPRKPREKKEKAA